MAASREAPAYGRTPVPMQEVPPAATMAAGAAAAAVARGPTHSAVVSIASQPVNHSSNFNASGETIFGHFRTNGQGSDLLRIIKSPI